MKRASDRTVEGTPGPDVIWGGDIVDGRGGDDLICSLNGHDLVLGGPGDDKLDGGDNQDTLEGGPGDDYLLGNCDYYAGVPGGETVSYEHASGPVSVDLSQGIATGEGTDTLGCFREIVGSDYDDTLRATSERHDNGDYIDGRGGDDVIYGSRGNHDYREVLIGREGNDSLYGLWGWELIFGGTGDDRLYGNRGVDSLRGGPGADQMDGGIGDDSVSYGEVYVYGLKTHPGAQAAIRADFGKGKAVGEGHDTFSNVEYLGGSEFDDVLLGDGGPNSLEGSGGNDILRGWGGDDHLGDGTGTDEVFGGRGDDYLGSKDEAGGDTFDGSRGKDTCKADPGDIRKSCEH